MAKRHIIDVNGHPLTITVNGLMEQLNLSKNIAYNLCRRKDFPSNKIGKRIIIPVDVLNRWLEAHEGQIIEDVGNNKK